DTHTLRPVPSAPRTDGQRQRHFDGPPRSGTERDDVRASVESTERSLDLDLERSGSHPGPGLDLERERSGAAGPGPPHHPGQSDRPPEAGRTDRAPAPAV